jgi:hypothetical protein
VAIICVAGLGTAVLLSSFGGRAAPAAVILRRERLCPAWGKDLAGLATAEDGCAVCPECDSAWRLSHERCPVCRYQLSGLPPDQDGQVTCPECGARS